ncbi:MAG: nitroreductase family deazaflavin-dependent oxidoreductase [Thermomicrobiales bacterium]
MATRTPIPRYVKLANIMTRNLIRAGIPLNGPGASPMYLLTVRGRKSGEPRTTPIATIEQEGTRYLMTPYGAVDWVRNLRAAGEGTLTRGRRTERFSAHELTPDEGGMVIRRFAATDNPIARFFEIPADASDEDFVQVATLHPVFRIEPIHLPG